MDVWKIYSFGGGAILVEIFNAVAMLCKSNSEYFTPVLKLSASVGAIWAAVRAIWKTDVGLFGKSWFVPTYLVLSILLVPKSSINIIDNTDSGFVTRTIDHIPLGLAVIAGSTSTFCYELTKMIEGVIGSNDEKLRYSNSGPMFAAKIVAMSRDVRIADPVQRQNLKDFTKQCFMWPYVFTNIEPGSSAALKSEDIIGFVRANPHPGLGIYWRDDKGIGVFKSCKDCVGEVTTLLTTAHKKPLEQMVTEFWSKKESDLTNDMKSYADSGWQHIGIGSQGAYELTGQQMVINAYRESLDDQREAAGAPRLHPNLIASSSVRGQAQQNAGFLVSGAMAAEHLPSIQAVVFAMLVLMFVFIIPISMLPGGLSVFALWAKAIFWVQSWPIFYAVLHAIGMMFYQKSAATVLMGNGEGLTLLTYNGIADVAWNSYCAVQSMFLTIPVLSWGLLTGSSSAIVQLAGSFAPTQGASLGAGIADGNQTFDTQAMHTRAMQSFQYGQQQLRPNFAMATSIQDGDFSRTTSLSGETTFQENISSLKLTPHLHQGVENSISEALNESTSNVQTLSTEYAAQEADTFAKAYNLAEGFSKMQNTNESFTAEENKSFNETFSKFQNAANKLVDNAQLTDSTGANLKAGSNPPLAFSAILKAAGVSVGGDVYRSSNDSSTLQKLEEAGFGEEDREAFAKGYNDRISKGVGLQDSETASMVQSYNQSLSKTQSLAQRHASALSRQESLANTQSYLSKHGANLSMNQTDDLLQKVGNIKFHYMEDSAARKAAAADLERKNPAVFANVAAPILTDMYTRNAGRTSADIESRYYSQNASISQQYTQEQTATNSSNAAFMYQESQRVGVHQNSVQNHRSERQSRTAAVGNAIEEPIPNTDKQILPDLHNKYESRKEKTTIRRAITGDKQFSEILSPKAQTQDPVRNVQQKTMEAKATAQEPMRKKPQKSTLDLYQQTVSKTQESEQVVVTNNKIKS